MKREKERIYRLKGQILQHMVEAGVHIGGRFHRFEFGNWAEVLEGQGYRFHRPCPQQELASDDQLLESLEAKPKEAKEPAIEIAFEVVEKFLEGKPWVSVYEWPGHHHRRHYRWDDDWDDDDDRDEDYDDRY